MSEFDEIKTILDFYADRENYKVQPGHRMQAVMVDEGGCAKLGLHKLSILREKLKEIAREMERG